MFYESDLSADPCMQISLKDIVCLGVSRPDPSSNNGVLDRCVCVCVLCPPGAGVSQGRLFHLPRFHYSFELYLTSEKLHHFGLETAEALHSWTRSIGKVGPPSSPHVCVSGTRVTVLSVPLQAATPLSCHCLLTQEFERVGLLRYRAMLDPQQWRDAYFVLQKSNLFICPLNDGAAEDIINLKRLQELSQSSFRCTSKLWGERLFDPLLRVC